MQNESLKANSTLSSEELNRLVQYVSLLITINRKNKAKDKKESDHDRSRKRSPGLKGSDGKKSTMSNKTNLN